MIRLLPLLVGFGFGLVSASAQAQTADFTGFYAGVNAGYGFEREKSDTRSRVGPGSPLPDARAADGLPPSASAAAAALRRPAPARP